MEFQDFFPVWKDLTPSQQKKISENIGIRSVPKGTVLHNGSQDCTGLLLIRTGQLRAYILSDEGRQITLYRLFDRDLCLFSASCIMRSIQFDIVIEAEKDTEFWIIPAEIYKSVMEESAIEETDILKITHETIGSHLGNPREVVTRMLHYFQKENIVKLSRGTVEITDKDRLREICDKG